MARWRLVTLVVLLALVGVPLAMPFIDLLTTHHTPLPAPHASLSQLALNTFFLVVGVLAIAMPVGTAAAVLLYRTDLPGQRFFRFFIVLMLFVPLHVLTTAWQVALGSAGLWSLSGRPWAEGLGPTIWIHALAALPWVVLIVGQGLRGVEPELEEDALLSVGPWRVLWSVTLSRSKGAIAAAAVWVGLQVSGEVAVADQMLVDTFAREIYNEFSLGRDDAVARAVALALPLVVIVAVFIYWCLLRLDAILPPLAAQLTEPRRLGLRLARWPLFALVFALFMILVGVPLGSLVWKTGLVGYPSEWSASVTAARLGSTLAGDANLLWQSLLTMFVSAALTASLALLCCWLATDTAWFRRVLFLVIAIAWSVPGPIIGIGLKDTIGIITNAIPLPVLTTALYHGPSPVPVLWAHVIRFLPCAVVVLWPAARMLPRELRDAMQLDGASPLQELQHLVWPLLRRTWLVVVVVVAALSLGEVGAVAMRVETPGWVTFAHELFNRMHYGQTQDVTALCVVLLMIVAVGGMGVALARRVFRLASSRRVNECFPSLHRRSDSNTP